MPIAQELAPAGSASMFGLETLSLDAWMSIPLVTAVAVVVVYFAHLAVFSVLHRVAVKAPGEIFESLVRHGRNPSLIVLVILVLILVLPHLDLANDLTEACARVLSLAMMIAIGWLAFRLLRTIDDVVSAQFDIEGVEDTRVREIHTRAQLSQRFLGVLVVLLTASFVLMSIPSIRQIGVTLFASAGIAGIVAGFAARPVLSNLLAGFQIALTQPIRIDDVVIVEGEWGWIEEIRMTFVVVRIWDLRCLVVPLTYFIEKPFQNWTRTSADILGTVFVYTDYSVPVDRVRDELQRVLEGTALWDGKVWNVQVTNASERTMELRALMSARSSGDAWELRCLVREKLIDFLQREFPQSLPVLRAQLTSDEAYSAPSGH